MPKVTVKDVSCVETGRVESEEPLTPPSSPVREDRFEDSRPDWWGYCNPPNSSTISLMNAVIESHAQTQARLNSAGIVTISKHGTQVLPTLEQLNKIKELIATSDKPLYFLMETAGDKIRYVEAFTKKKDWLGSLPITMPDLRHVSIDKESQTNWINDLCDELAI